MTLTPRQTEIAELLAARYSQTEVARILGISRHTVRSHARTLHHRLPGSGPLRARLARWMEARDVLKKNMEL